MSFESLGLPRPLLEVIARENYKQAYPIQEQVIPVILEGKDVLGIAQTGSGKTASYVLPILTSLKPQEGPKNRQARVLVLVPTRELAEQVKDVFNTFSSGLSHKVRTVAVYGGVSINPQMKALYGASIVVATPGRLIELAEANAVQFDQLETLILDEADKLLNLGFQEEMNMIFEDLPAQRQNLLFSATLNEKVDGINRVLLKDQVTVNVAPEEWNISQINQVAYFVEEEKKGPLLRHLIRKEDMQQVLIFTASGKKADNVAQKLTKNGIRAKSIHGKKTQHVRNETLKEFKTGKLRVLVATDLLARGVDIEFLPYVINYELPRSPKDYVHRIGRTGRAEATGEAITLVVPADEHHFKIIQKKMKYWVNRVDGNAIELT